MVLSVSMSARALSCLLVLLAACRPARSPRAVAEAAIDAADRHDARAALALQVSPELLARLVECEGDRERWLTPEGRREQLDKMRARLDEPGAAWRVKLVSFEEEDRATAWKSYLPGDRVRGRSCRVKTAFAREKYRIVLKVVDDREKQASKPMELWRVGSEWYVWDDPMDTEVR